MLDEIAWEKFQYLLAVHENIYISLYITVTVNRNKRLEALNREKTVILIKVMILTELFNI